MGILSWIFVGLVAGAIAKFIMPGDDPGGFFMTMVIGIVGGLIGGFIGTTMGWGELTGFFDMRSMLLAIGGSLVLLVVWRAIKKRG